MGAAVDFGQQDSQPTAPPEKPRISATARGQGSGVRFCDSQRRIILMLPSESQNRTPDPGDFATVNIEGM